jgi:hypothetical protein
MGTVRVQEAVILLDGLSNALRLAVYLYQTEIGQKTKSAW